MHTCLRCCNPETCIHVSDVVIQKHACWNIPVIDKVNVIYDTIQPFVYTHATDTITNIQPKKCIVACLVLTILNEGANLTFNTEIHER